MRELKCLHVLLGTNSERLAYDIALVSEGKHWIETDTGYWYVKHDGAWHTPPVGGGGPHTHPESDVVNLPTDLDGKAPVSHNQDATTINSGTLDGDRLPGLSQTKKGGAPATGAPSGKYLKDDGTWSTPAGSVAWGAITGTLSNQTDLNNALNGKAPAAEGVTNGNSHDHAGGDGGTIDHANLTGVTATQHHTNINDPTAGQKAALPGTNGTPGDLNRYVTDSDPRNANARIPTVHGLGGAEHSADTLANLNLKISDADVVALAGQIGGSASAPDIRGLRESGGPTLLTVGAVADGEFLKRSGANIVSSQAGGGSGELWEGKVHANMLDGNPMAEPFMAAATSTTISTSVTPTNIGIAVGRLVAFRFKTPITVATIRWYGIAAVAGIYTAAIYRDSDGARLWNPVNVDTLANAWGSNNAGGLPIAFAADTLYWFGIGADSTGTTAGFVTPPVPRQQAIGLAVPAWAGLTAIGLRYCQVALTAGAWPATLPAKANAAAWTGFIPVFYLCASGY